MLVCYLRAMGRPKSFVLLLPCLFPIFINIQCLQSDYCCNVELKTPFEPVTADLRCLIPAYQRSNEQQLRIAENENI